MSVLVSCFILLKRSEIEIHPGRWKLLCCHFPNNNRKQNQQRELLCTVLITLLIPNMPTSSSIQISSKSVTSPWHCEGGSTQLAKGSSLLMHVIGEALVWVSDFRLQRLCAPWSLGGKWETETSLLNSRHVVYSVTGQVSERLHCRSLFEILCKRPK